MMANMQAEHFHWIVKGCPVSEWYSHCRECVLHTQILCHCSKLCLQCLWPVIKSFFYYIPYARNFNLLLIWNFENQKSFLWYKSLCRVNCSLFLFSLFDRFKEQNINKSVLFITITSNLSFFIQFWLDPSEF